MADKTTAQQQTDDYLYHGRNLTLRGMALSNWIREYFDESLASPSGEFPYGICFGGDTIRRFVAVGAATSVALQQSPNGSFWQYMALGKKLGAFAGVLRDVCYGNELYVAVGDAEEIQTAPEALPAKWDQRRNGETDTFYGVCYGNPGGNPLYVAVGENGAIYTSPDGITWTKQAPDASYVGNFRGVVWTGIRFVAVGDGGEIQTSPDGLVWSAQAAYGANVADFLAVTVGLDIDGNTRVMAVGDPVAGSIPIVQTSPTGLVWSEQTPLAGIYDDQFDCVAYAGGVYIAAGPSAELQVSYDFGETWVHQGAANLSSNDIAFGEGVFVMVGGDNKTFSGVSYGIAFKTLKMA